jgi:hypothetical protein
MVTIVLSSLLVGAVLAARLRVYVLYPASILALVIVATVATLKGEAMSSAIMAAIACVISLQTGYLGGLFTRFCMAASRVASERPLRATIGEN